MNQPNLRGVTDLFKEQVAEALGNYDDIFKDLVAKSALGNYEAEGCVDLNDPCDSTKVPDPCCGSHYCGLNPMLSGTRDNYLIANDNYAAEEGCTDAGDPCTKSKQCCGTHICATSAWHDGAPVCQQPVCTNN